MNKILFLTGILVIFLNLRLLGQENNSKNNDNPTPDHVITKKHNYLNAKFREENTLLKFGLSPFQFSIRSGEQFYSELNSAIIFEKKIEPSVSIFTSVNYNYSGNFTNSSLWQISNDMGIRYYYSMKKRMKNAIGANNFHGNYISFSADKWLVYSIHEIENMVSNDWSRNPNLTLSWGLQRRIKTWGFIDLGTYIKYLKDTDPNRLDGSFGFGFSFKFGIAYGWK